MDMATSYVVAVLFVATVIRSAFGFGEALVAVPLLAYCLPLKEAAPLAVLVSITVAGWVVLRDWRQIHLASAAWLVGATLFGIPLGLLLLTSRHQTAAKVALGALIIGFAGYSLLGERLPHLESDRKGWLLVCGFLAGIFGGAYGMNGPPLAIYGSLRRWPPQRFRATLQAYFLPASLLGMAGYWWQGLWTWPVTRYYLVALPMTCCAVWIGYAINRRVKVETFQKYVYAGLALIGAGLLAEAFRG